MNWIYYLLEANLYFIIFYIFYRLFLYKETFYTLNRAYLMVSSISSFAFPFFQLGILKPVSTNIGQPKWEEIPNQINFAKTIDFKPVQQSVYTLENGAITIYLLIASFFLVKFIFGIFKIIKLRKLPYKEIENGIKLIDLNGSKTAFSFFNWLFINHQLQEKETVIKHEMVHIKQKHSFDVVFFELFQIINWFNPFSYLIKKDIKLVHEYLADEATTQSEIKKYDYALFLIQNSTGVQSLNLANQIFSSSILKQRIKMLNQKKSGNWARLKFLFALPLVAGVICISTMAFTKNYGVVDLYANKKIALPDTSKFVYTTTGKLEKNTNIFVTDVSVSSKKIQTSKEKRLIVINGAQIKNNNDFFAASNYETKNELKPNVAFAKYGEKGKYGAIELTGKKIKVIKDLGPPPPPLPPLPPLPPAIEQNPNKGKRSKKTTAKSATIKGPEEVNTLRNVIILDPPPKLANEVNRNVSKLDLILDRTKGEILITPESEKGNKSVSIYSESGEKIFEVDNYKDDWDGKINSYTKKKLPAGQYSYEIVIAQAKSSDPAILRGYITLK